MRKLAPKFQPWPPRDRDPADVAAVASRLLVAAGRLESRVSAIARGQGIDQRVARLLLLYAESNRPLRIGNIAELLGVSHSTAGRAAQRAYDNRLVDRIGTVIDGREVTIRITVAGRIAVTQLLDALRPHAAQAFGLTTEATAHPRGIELSKLLGAPPYLLRSSENAGWRAGVRAGCPADA